MDTGTSNKRFDFEKLKDLSVNTVYPGHGKLNEKSNNKEEN